MFLKQLKGTIIFIDTPMKALKIYYRALASLEEVFKKHAPGFAFNYEFYDDWMQAKYVQEEKRSHRGTNPLGAEPQIFEMDPPRHCRRNPPGLVLHAKVAGGLPVEILWRHYAMNNPRSHSKLNC